MCPHNEFDILHYDGSLMVRKCKHCKDVEIRVEYWSDFESLLAICEKVKNEKGL